LLFQFVEELQHVGVDLLDVRVVQLENVDPLEAEPVEGFLERLLEVLPIHLLGQLAVARLGVVVEVVADLGRDGDLVADALQRPPDELLGGTVAVHVPGVEVGDSPIDRVADHVDRFLVASVAPPVAADDPRAEADLGDLDVGRAERAVVHTPYWMLSHLSVVVHPRGRDPAQRGAYRRFERSVVSAPHNSNP